MSTAREPLDDQKFYRVYPRWLYVEYDSPIGVLRLGQQGSHWAMGLVANDGDHPQMFGDNLGGSIVERLLFATTPLGKGTPLVIALGADLVLTDPTARLIEDGDEALEAVLAALWRTKHAEAGVYGVIRHQTRDEQATGPFTPFSDQLTVGVVDATGKFDAPVPAMPLGRIYGQFEAAWIVGSTDYLRDTYTQQASATAAHTDESIRSFGAAATLGVLRLSGLEEAWRQARDRVRDRLCVLGDANPYDGVTAVHVRSQSPRGPRAVQSSARVDDGARRVRRERSGPRRAGGAGRRLLAVERRRVRRRVRELRARRSDRRNAARF